MSDLLTKVFIGSDEMELYMLEDENSGCAETLIPTSLVERYEKVMDELREVQRELEQYEWRQKVKMHRVNVSPELAVEISGYQSAYHEEKKYIAELIVRNFENPLKGNVNETS